MPRLRRSDCHGPGYSRRRAGRGFVFVDAAGNRVTDEATLMRIRALVLAPRRTQYRYLHRETVIGAVCEMGVDVQFGHPAP
jgi:hypothetical protein